MAEISAKLVKELRDRTGAGMMDCKRALQETNGDIEAAIVLLRERGMAQAAKRAGRETTEGKVGYRLAEDGRKGTLVAVGCETEPVSNNDEFLAFAKKVLEAVDANGVGAEAELEEERVSLSAKLGENIVVAGTARFEAVDGARIAAYVHPPANKLGVLVQVRGGDEELGRKLAMHIAASGPQWISRDDVPAEAVEAERDIYANSDEVQSKPEQAREKIVDGMLNKRFFGANVLVEQDWIHDTAKTVGEALQEAGAEVLEFERFALALTSDERATERRLSAGGRRARVPAHPAEALRRGADGRPEYGIDLAVVEARRGDRGRPRRRGADRARRRRREHLPRHGRGRAGHGPRDRRLRGDARHRPQRAHAPGRARASGARHARPVRARHPRGGRAVHPPPRRSGTSRRTGSSSSRPAPATRTSRPTRRPRCGRSRSTPTRSSWRRTASPASTTATRATTANATFLPRLTHLEAIERGLKVMDTTALSLCMDNSLPIHVFELEDGNIGRVVAGEDVGTIITTPDRGGPVNASTT